MTMPRISDDEFIRLFKESESVNQLAKVLDVDLRFIYRRRRALENKHSMVLETKNSSKHIQANAVQSSPSSINLEIENGHIIVFSDAHFLPGRRTTAYQGVLWAIKKFSPVSVVCNGDAFDGGSISRHPSIMWDSTPSVVQELQACQEYLGEIETLAKKRRHNVRLVFPIGNHDARFESRLALTASEFRGVKGFTLKEHFMNWEFCWSVWPNSEVVIKHRWKGGIHATHGNTQAAGVSFITGHLHSLKVSPWTDYTGTRFGVDTGTLAEPYGPQFADYTELNPVNWRSGFILLTFKDGKMLWPEVISTHSATEIDFRGEVIDVSGL